MMHEKCYQIPCLNPTLKQLVKEDIDFHKEILIETYTDNTQKLTIYEYLIFVVNSLERTSLF
jgi:hypothetical protein